MSQGGDYLAPGTYEPSELGFVGGARRVVRYMESVRLSERLGGAFIQVEADPQSDGSCLARDIAFLKQHFGSFADYLYRAARGIDLRPVQPDRPRKSVGGERTFASDLSTGPVLRETLDTIADIVWDRIERAEARGRTVTLKLRYADFSLVTRARSVPHCVAGKAEFAALGHALLDDMLPLPQPIRLMGLTLSALEGEPEERAKDTAQLSLL